VPAVHDRLLAETELLGAIRIICETRPIQGKALHHFYDDRLLPSIWRANLIREEEEARTSARNAYFLQVAREAHEKQTQVVQKRDAATSRTRARLEALDEVMHRAQEHAAACVTHTGVPYDSENPTERAVLYHTPRPLEVFADALQLPWPTTDPSTLIPGPLGWFITVMIGAMIGVSFGIIAGFLHPDTLGREAAIVVPCAILGFAVAVCSKYTLRLAWQHPSERYYLGKRIANWLPFLFLAFLLFFALVPMDGVLEKEGLLKLARSEASMRSLSGGNDTTRNKEGLYLLIAMILTLPYFVNSGIEGYVIGRRQVIRNRLLARQAIDFEAMDTARRNLPEIQEALHAIAQVREVQRQQRELEARIARIAEPFDREIAELETRKQPICLELSMESKRRYQEALDQMHATQEIFDTMFWREVTEVTSSGGCLARLWRKAWARRAPYHRGRERTRKIT